MALEGAAPGSSARVYEALEPMIYRAGEVVIFEIIPPPQRMSDAEFRELAQLIEDRQGGVSLEEIRAYRP